MSEKNKEIVRKVNASFENHDPEGFLSVCINLTTNNKATFKFVQEKL